MIRALRLMILRRRAERSAAASLAYTGQPAGGGWAMPVDRALRQRAERDALAYAAEVAS